MVGTATHSMSDGVIGWTGLETDVGSPALTSKAEALWTYLRCGWLGSCPQASSATRSALRRA